MKSRASHEERGLCHVPGKTDVHAPRLVRESGSSPLPQSKQSLYHHNVSDTKPTFFPTPAKFRAWLEKNHAKESELLVGFYKRDSGKPSITWPESVDQALCFGWIDGIRRRIDGESYSIRFTPRKATSNWSRINIDRVAELTKQGLMTETGRTAFETRKAKRDYAYEANELELDPAYEKKFRASKKAWTNFMARTPSYRRTTKFWVMSAKRVETREKRLGILIDCSERGVDIGPMYR
jgi:uncharacterized protein YdeI (YjbR/CyaY-like superfamily)